MYHLLSREAKLKKGIHEDAVITLVDVLLCDAISKQASDIHFQPTQRELLVRYRIDGVLYDCQSFEIGQAPLLISRLKVLANLDIAERRIPQDGRFRVLFDDGSPDSRMIDFRVSTFPTLYGEKMVVRILDRAVRLLGLNALGLSDVMQQQLINLIQRPHGLFLVTGPTGCGKTTMLYALLAALNPQAKNIVTIEDPIEYELQGITQSQINPKAGFTFDTGLRAMLRQDPDIIMIGEIRDRETAQIAIESALTGHLVLSTLHTNDASSAVMRLLEMGIEPYLISATLVGVLAQRLARRLCPACKREITVTKEMVDAAYHGVHDLHSAFAAEGCKNCHQLGYKGRIGLFELLTMDDDLRLLVMQKADVQQMRKHALSHGMQTLMYDGLAKVKDGVTTLEELVLIALNEARYLD